MKHTFDTPLKSGNDYWWSNQEVVPFWKDELFLLFLHVHKVNAELKTTNQSLANLIVNDFSKIMNDLGCDWESCPIHPVHLSELTVLKDSGIITNATMKTMLDEMFSTGKTPMTILVEKPDYISVSDEDEISKIISSILNENMDVVEKVQAGHRNSLGFLMGKVMKATQGKAKPDIVKSLLEKMAMEFKPPV